MSSQIVDDDDSQVSCNDEILRKLLKPNPSTEQVIAIIQSTYIPVSKQSVIISSEGTSTCNKVVPIDDDIVTIELVSQLDSYDDCNYHVKIDNVSYVLKIHNGVESKDYIDCFNSSKYEYYKKGYGYSVLHYQNAILDVLKNHSIPANVIIPPSRHNNNNNTNNSDAPISLHFLPVVSDKHSPCELAVRLLSWVPGCPMSSISCLPIEAIAIAGRFLGNMNSALDTMTNSTSASNHSNITTLTTDYYQKKISEHLNDSSILKAGQRYHQWDGKNFLSIRSFVQYITSQKRQMLIESILDAYDKQIIQKQPKFRVGINHGDFNDANILMDKSNFVVTGVIDFGDSTESWRVLDIAVAMAYALLTTFGKANRSIAAAAAMLRGYNSVYPLLMEEFDHLFLLMICRLACSCTLGAYSMHQNPGNTYLLLHSAPAWNALELLWGYDADYRIQMSTAVNKVFKQACSLTDCKDGIINCSDIMFPDPDIVDFLAPLRVTGPVRH